MIDLLGFFLHLCLNPIVTILYISCNGMWHEARRREKATQKLLNEHKKRAEKRREENRVDPSSLLQINGLKSKLYLDTSIYKQAVKSLVPWQGDKSVLIDRFDVRATLTSIPRDDNPPKSLIKEPGRNKTGSSTVIDVDESEIQKKILNYERYRLLIQNDLSKTPEVLRLKLVSRGETISDAKLKKLRYNKFGTSGDASIANSHISQERSKMRQPPATNESTRRGAAIGFNYSAVPPPVSLTDNLKKPTTADAKDERNIYDNIIDLNDDDLCLDSVNLHSFDEAKINETAKRYGLTSEELAIIVEKESKDIDTNSIMKELQKLTQKSAEKSRQQVYGPALPPELMARTQVDSRHPPSNYSGSSNSSPVQQRSPSGADIPLRGHVDTVISDRDESNPSSNHSDTSSKPCKRDLDHSKLITDSKCLENKDSSRNTSDTHALGESLGSKPLKDTTGEHSIEQVSTVKESSRMTDKGEPDQEERRSSRRDRADEQHPPRRASTPLLYKRHRRSSRSLSRERRRKCRHEDSSSTRHHRTRR